MRILLCFLIFSMAGCANPYRKMDAIAWSAMGPMPSQKKADQLRTEIRNDVKQAISQARASAPAVPSSIIVEHYADVFAEPAPAHHAYVDPSAATSYLGD